MNDTHKEAEKLLKISGKINEILQGRAIEIAHQRSIEDMHKFLENKKTAMKALENMIVALW